jgi:hypothetical protein
MVVKYGSPKVTEFLKGGLAGANSKLAKYNLGLVAVQEVGWVDGGSQQTIICFCMEINGNANHHLGKGFFVRKGNKIST